jgi:receptor protein-tyrosine kinase
MLDARPRRPVREAERRTVNIRRYGEVIRRRWKAIVACTLLIVLATVIGLAYAKPTYSSSVEMFVTTPGRGSTQAYEGSLFSAQRVTSYAKLAKGQQLARDVVSQLGLAMSPKDLADRVSVDVPTNTVILDIAVTDRRPVQAQRIAQTFAERLAATVATLETPASGTSAAVRLTIVDPANRPTTPISPKPLRDLGLALAIGLALGLGLAFIRDMLDSSLRTPEDVSAATGVSVLATVHEKPHWRKNSSFSTSLATGPEGEVFRILRTSLQFADTNHDSHVFTITSPLRSEGKTTTARNLGSAYAQAGYQVLLLDADLRHPHPGDNPGLPDVVGLTGVLVDGVQLEEAVQHGLAPNLTVLPSGATPSNPSELLQSAAMVDLLEQARKTYDTVIIDSPPLLPVTDAAVLAAQSDGALLVLHYGKTTRGDLRAAVQRLGAVEAKILGAVLNRVPKRNHGGRNFEYTDNLKTGH